MKQTRRRSVLLSAGLLLAAGCAGDPEVPPAEPTELERLRDRSNAYPAFHVLAELTVGDQTVPVEMAWRAPDRALLKYGSGTRVLFDGGTARVFSGGSRYEMDYAAELRALEKRYGLRVPGRSPEPVFILTNWKAVLRGNAPRATVAWRRLGARLGWLDDLARFRRDGDGYRWGAIRIELTEDGFIERAKIGMTGRFELKRLSLDPPPDALFEPPDAGDFKDVGARIRPRQSKALEDEFHRWFLASDPDDATLRALVRGDLKTRYEPDKMVDLLRTNLSRTLDAYRRGGKAVDPVFLRAKLEIERGKTRTDTSIMADEIRSDFHHELDRYFRGMEDPPERSALNRLADRWLEAVELEVDTQLRRPFERVFETALDK